MTDYEALKTAVMRGKRNDVTAIVRQALEAGEDVNLLLDRGMIPAMREIGDRFSRNEAYVPELLIAARAMQAGMALIEPLIADSGADSGIYPITLTSCYQYGGAEVEETMQVNLKVIGGSGVSDDGFRTAIKNGIRKINYYSYMSKAGYEAAKAEIESGKSKYLHDVEFAAMKAMKEDVKKAIKTFANL